MTIDMSPAQAAFRALGEHCATCETCTAVNPDGSNANLSCATAERLYQLHADARRATSLAGSTAAGEPHS